MFKLSHQKLDPLNFLTRNSFNLDYTKSRTIQNQIQFIAAGVRLIVYAWVASMKTIRDKRILSCKSETLELKQHWETGIEISFKNRKKKTKPLLFPSVSYRKLKFLFWWWLKQHRCFSHTSIISLSNLMQSFKFIYILFFVFWILSPSSLCNFLTLNFDILKFPSWFAYIYFFSLSFTTFSMEI